MTLNLKQALLSRQNINFVLCIRLGVLIGQMCSILLIFKKLEIFFWFPETTEKVIFTNLVSLRPKNVKLLRKNFYTNISFSDRQKDKTEKRS